MVVTASYTNVTVSEAKTLIDSTPSLVILDVRTQSEYDSGHIRNSKLIPVTELESRLDELNTTDEILVYCLSGGRSSSASQILVDNGFLHVYNMLEGITAWINAGYAVYVKYSSIQEAINNADGGDIIHVSSGIYYGKVVVNKTVLLIGENAENTIIDGEDIGNVVEVTSSDVFINSFTIQNSNRSAGTSFAGIRVLGSRCNVTQNQVTKSKIGILLVVSEGNAVRDNVVTGNGHGVSLYDCNGNVVDFNVFSGNTIGISLAFSSGNVVANNDVRNSSAGGHGVTLQSNSFNNTVSDNNLVLNYHGMWLSNSFDNRIVRNTFADNELLGLELSNSPGNLFYHNNFIDSPTLVKIGANSTCSWDSGCEGNYWSNYNGADPDEDGIGDEYLPWEGVDYYPLMNIYWNPGDINHDLKVNMRDVGGAARAFSTEPGDERWNCHADITGLKYLLPDNKVDMRDIGLVASQFGDTYY